MCKNCEAASREALNNLDGGKEIGEMRKSHGLGIVSGNDINAGFEAETQERPDGTVGQAANQLHKEVEILAEVADRLIMRLSPILRNTEANSTEDRAVKAGDSDLASILFSRAESVAYTRQRLSNAINSIDL